MIEMRVCLKKREQSRLLLDLWPLGRLKYDAKRCVAEKHPFLLLAFGVSVLAVAAQVASVAPLSAIEKWLTVLMVVPGDPRAYNSLNFVLANVLIKSCSELRKDLSSAALSRGPIVNQMLRSWSPDGRGRLLKDRLVEKLGCLSE